MKPENQHIELMKFMGWKNFFYDSAIPVWFGLAPKGVTLESLPPLTLDLMHEAEKLIENNGALSWSYMDELRKITLPDVTGWWMLRATAPQRLEALLRTVGLWREEV